MEGIGNKLGWATGGAAVVVIAGFLSGVLVFGASAKADATKQMNAAVKAAVSDVLTPLCVEKARGDAELEARIVELTAASTYNRAKTVVGYGWTDNNDVAQKCAAEMLAV